MSLYELIFLINWNSFFGLKAYLLCFQCLFTSKIKFKISSHLTDIYYDILSFSPKFSFITLICQFKCFILPQCQTYHLVRIQILCVAIRNFTLFFSYVEYGIT